MTLSDVTMKMCEYFSVLSWYGFVEASANWLKKTGSHFKNSSRKVVPAIISNSNMVGRSGMKSLHQWYLFVNMVDFILNQIKAGHEEWSVKYKCLQSVSCWAKLNHHWSLSTWAAARQLCKIKILVVHWRVLNRTLGRRSSFFGNNPQVGIW